MERAAPRAPNSPTWSTVWFAPVPRSSGGRSAVSDEQRDARLRRLEHGRVQVRRGGAGRGDHHAPGAPDALASPSARNPADRSSTRTCSRSRPAASAACRAKASGADREPGREHRLADAAADQLVDEHPRQRGRRVHTRGPGQPDVAARAGRPPGLRGPGRREPRGEQGRVGPTARTGSGPSAGSSGSATTSAASSRDRAPARRRTAAPAARRPARPRRRCPTDVSSALTTRRPAARMRPRPAAPAGPRPAAATLSTTMSAASAQRDPHRVVGLADRLVGGDRDVRPGAGAPRPARPRSRTAARRTPARPRPRPARQRVDRGRDRPAAVGVDPDPPVRTERVADRLDPGHVVGEATDRARRPSPSRSCSRRTRASTPRPRPGRPRARSR